jgi:Fuc2NAc and GlcNAc transferase
LEISEILLLLLAWPTAWALAGVVRHYALGHGILDVPNQRSSHTVPTPRGGGLAIVVTVLGGVAVLAVSGQVPYRLAMALGGGGLLVAGIGWLDDRQSLSPQVRAAVQVLAAAWGVAWLGGLPGFSVGSTSLRLGWLGSLLAVVATTWSINLYNFMDGIDGLAGSEAVAAATVGGVLLALNRASGLAQVSWLLALGCLGFLAWNWPPAKIFMGDVGSGFVGFVFAMLAVATERSGALPLLVWLILLGVFLVDATSTLIRRVRRGERWFEAHRTHAYQLAVQAGHSHRQVTLAVLGMNAGLASIAIAAWRWPTLTGWFTLVVGAVLMLLWSVAIGRFTRSGISGPGGRASQGC